MLWSRMTKGAGCSLVVALIAVVAPVLAAPQQPADAPQDDVLMPKDHAMPDMADAPDEHAHGMAAASQFEAREASGTAWLPDATPMYGFHRTAGTWELMFHGNGFVQLLHEAAPEHRGDTQAGSINWAMAMARRPLAGGRFGVRTMMSLEPWTIAGCGYPNLLATGELCDGDDIHDKQHPHDLFMEVAVEFDRPLTSSVRWQVYGALAGEPALGPAAFPHRLSAMPNPISPIIHHWVDATHISFGVMTTGVYGARWKAEGSVFNGREPDEVRHDFDFGPMDSVSGRVSFLPTEALAVQVSAGRLHEAELSSAGGPRVDVLRVTSSATYHRGFGGRHMWATTVAWGVNREEGETTHGVLVESAATFDERDAWFGRLEVNAKPAHDLHIHESDGVFRVGKIQAGYTRYLGARRGLQTGVGGFVSAAVVPEALRPRYGGVGVGVGLHLTVRPAQHQMASMVEP